MIVAFVIMILPMIVFRDAWMTPMAALQLLVQVTVQRLYHGLDVMDSLLDNGLYRMNVLFPVIPARLIV